MHRQNLSGQGGGGGNHPQPRRHAAHDASEGDDYGLRRDRGYYLNQGQGMQRWTEQGLGQEGVERGRYSDRAENYRNGRLQVAPPSDGSEGYGGPVDTQHGHAVEGYGGQSGYGADDFGSSSRRAAGRLRADADITEEARAMLADNPAIDARDIDVACFQGQVTLQGSVPDASMRRLAESLIAYSHGVHQVRNRLTVGSAYAPPMPRAFNGENS